MALNITSQPPKKNFQESSRIQTILQCEYQKILEAQQTNRLYNPSFKHTAKRALTICSVFYRFKHQFKLSIQIVNESIAYFDVVLSLIELEYEQFELVAKTCLSLVIEQQYGRERGRNFAPFLAIPEIEKYQETILNLLEGDKRVVTPLEVAGLIIELPRFQEEIEAAFQRERKESVLLFKEHVERVYKILCLNYSINGFMASFVGLGVVILAREMLGFNDLLTQEMEDFTGLSSRDIEESFDSLQEVYFETQSYFKLGDEFFEGGQCAETGGKENMSFLSSSSSKWVQVDDLIQLN